ncbi:MAG TPA: phage holin family protein [Syntrophorhabdaceae bacterium]|nr:phage holin family protein [Syntrophorhabdaceae bacterium]
MIIIKWFIMAFSILVISYYLPGVTVSSFLSALWVALFLGIINIFIKPVLIFITLPINILTLGLFTFVINAILVLFASSVIKGFYVQDFLSALLFGIILSAINYILNSIFFRSR